MGDDYIIRARIVAGDVTDRGVNSAKKKLDGVERRARGVGQSITRFLGRALAIVGGSYAFTRLARGVLGLQTEIEDATIGIGALLAATTGLEMAASIGIARKELQGLRMDAARGVGELGDYLVAYQQILTPVMQGGGNLATVRSLTKQALAVGALTRGQEGMRLAPMDIVQALTAGVGERTTPIVLQALRAAQFDTGKFNSLATSKKIEVLGEAFAKFDPAVEALGNTFGAQRDTLVDTFKEIARAGTGGLFERLKSGLGTVNTFLGDNLDLLMGWARQGGSVLTGLWDVGAGFFGMLAGQDKALRRIGARLSKLFHSLEQLGDFLSRLTFGSNDWWVAGNALLRVFAETITWTERMVRGFVYMGLGIESFVQQIMVAGDELHAIRTFQKTPGEALRSFTGRTSGISQDYGVRMREAMFGTRFRTFENAQLAGAYNTRQSTRAVASNVTNLNVNGDVKFEVKAEVNEDANRIAIAAREAFRKLLQHPRMGRRLQPA